MKLKQTHSGFSHNINVGAILARFFAFHKAVLWPEDVID